MRDTENTCLLNFANEGHQNLTRAEREALERLSERRELVIIKPDRGNGIVLLNRTDFERKMFSRLDDPSKFLPVNGTGYIFQG